MPFALSFPVAPTAWQRHQAAVVVVRTGGVEFGIAAFLRREPYHADVAEARYPVATGRQLHEAVPYGVTPSTALVVPALGDLVVQPGAAG